MNNDVLVFLEGERTDFRQAKKNIVLYLEHITKYRYEQKEQRENIGSWASTIVRALRTINDVLNNENRRIKLFNEIHIRFESNRYYVIALKDVNKYKRNKSIEIPERIPMEWEDLQIILSEEWLANFFVQYAYNQDIIDYLNRKYPDIMRLRTI